MVLSDLKELIPLLKINGVRTFKQGDLEISLAESSDLVKQDPLNGLKQQELAMPADLRTDSLHDYDKMLNWSAPDGAGDTLPLTGENAGG